MSGVQCDDVAVDALLWSSAASEMGGDAGWVTVMLLVVMVVMVGGWTITACIEVPGSWCLFWSLF